MLYLWKQAASFALFFDYKINWAQYQNNAFLLHLYCSLTFLRPWTGMHPPPAVSQASFARLLRCFIAYKYIATQIEGHLDKTTYEYARCPTLRVRNAYSRHLNIHDLIRYEGISITVSLRPPLPGFLGECSEQLAITPGSSSGDFLSTLKPAGSLSGRGSAT